MLHDSLPIRKRALIVYKFATSAESEECCTTQVQENMTPDEA
jgi:hypothetical protein